MDVLQSQSELLSQMTTSLQTISTNVNSIKDKFNTQAEIVRSLSDKFVKGKDELKSINTSLESLIRESERLKKIDVKKLKKILSISPKDTTQLTKNAVNSLDTYTDTLNEAANQNVKDTSLGLADTKELNKLATAAEQSSNETAAACKSLDKTLTTSKEKVEAGTSSLPTEEEMKKTTETSGSSFTFGGFWPIQILKGLYTLVKMGFNMMVTAIQVYVDLMKTLFTLPFTVANAAVKVGNELREEIFVKIGNKVEEFKDDFSLSSRIGKDIVKLGVLAEDAILKSKDTQTLFARTFDKENYTGALDSIKQTLQGLGSLAEYIGPTINKSNDTVIYVERMQRALGIGVEELKYYSIDAINNLTGLPEVLHYNAEAINKISKKENVDFKFLSKAFHVLRKNIVEFGHLSATELAEVSAKIIKMKISAEDVVGIFGKVSSFEQASNMSAQLFQSFGMVLDAYDMLSANDPMEIIEQLRGAMFTSGKHFEMLNRHEKALLKSTTGLSDHALKSVFSYSNLGKSQEEIARSMETKNPTELMTDGLQQMTAVIRTIKRTLTFNNPFKAIFDGLMENTAASKELITSSKKLSEAYEILQRSLMTIDDKEIEGFTIPLNIILRRFNRIITDGTLGNLFGKGISTVSDFLQDLYVQSTESRVDDLINDATHMLKMLEKAKDKKIQAQYALYEDRFVETIDDFNKAMPDQFKKIAAELGLIGKDGKLNPDLTLENMSQIMISALKSEDEAVVKYAESNFKQRLNFIKELKGQLKDILSGDKNLKLELEDVINFKGGVEGTLDRLYNGLESMLEEGTDLFFGIYKLGQSLMAGIFKGLIIGSTGLLLLLNGNIDKASDLLGAHIKELGDDNAILNFLKIDSNEFKTLTEDLELAASKFGDKTGDKLLPSFGFILTKLYESAGDLLNIMRPLVDNIIGTIYDTLSEGGLMQQSAAFGLKQIAGGAIARRNYSKLKENADLSDKQDIIDLFEGISATSNDERESTSYTRFLGVGHLLQELGEESLGLAIGTGNLFLDEADQVISHAAVESHMEGLGFTDASDIFSSLNNDTFGDQGALLNSYPKILEVLTQKYHTEKSKNLKMDRPRKIYLGNLIGVIGELNARLNDDKNAKEELLLRIYMHIEDYFPELVNKKANDIIKLHHNDEVEVVASKQGGMLRTLATSINDRFKESVNIAKATLKMAVLNRNEDDYESDEDLIHQVAVKLENYVDYVSNRKINIIQNSLEILEQ